MRTERNRSSTEQVTSAVPLTAPHVRFVLLPARCFAVPTQNLLGHASGYKKKVHAHLPPQELRTEVERIAVSMH
jgi:hypothetical protein